MEAGNGIPRDTECLFPLVLTHFIPVQAVFYREMKKILLPDLKFEKTKLKSKIPVIISHENVTSGPM